MVGEERDLSKEAIRLLEKEVRYHEFDADLSKEKLLEYEEEILTEGSDLRNIKDLTHRPGQSYKQSPGKTSFSLVKGQEPNLGSNPSGGNSR